MHYSDLYLSERDRYTGKVPAPISNLRENNSSKKPEEDYK